MQNNHIHPNTGRNERSRALKVLQYNVGKRRTVMLDFFNIEETGDVDIIAIQEPWRNTESKAIPNMDRERFELVSPVNDPKARVCFFVNKRAALASWSYKTHSSDLATLIVNTSDGRKVQIHNVYNQALTEGTTTRMELLSRVTGTPFADERGTQDEQMIVGDFNLHHPAGGGDNAKTDRGADELLDITEPLSMDQLLPRGTPTYTENSSTTIDLVFATPGIVDSLIQCRVAVELDAHSDHQPIMTSIEAELPGAPPRKIRMWKKTDQGVLTTKVKECIELNQELKRITAKQARWIETPEQLDQAAQDLTAAIASAIEESTPLGTILARSKVGFDEECKEAQMETRRLKKRYMGVGTEDSWDEFRTMRNYKNRLITRASRQAFRTFIAQACESPEAMWKKTKWSRDDTPKQASIPPLFNGQELVDDAAGKSRILMDTFFPPPRSSGAR